MTRYQNGDREEMDDTIAIVGMACRFPQEAENTEKLWELLINSRSACKQFNLSMRTNPHRNVLDEKSLTDSHSYGLPSK